MSYATYSANDMLLTWVPPVFCNSAGALAPNPAGYAELQLAPGRITVPAMAELLTHTGVLLLSRGWHGLLCNARAIDGFDEETMTWLLGHWLTQRVPQPPRLFKAQVVPASPAAQASFGRLRELAPVQARYAYFGCEPDAHAYLRALGT